jgi:hypothetical protein
MLLAWQTTFLGITSKIAGLVYSGGVGVASLILFAGMGLPSHYGILLMALLPSASDNPASGPGFVSEASPVTATAAEVQPSGRVRRYFNSVI